MVLPPISPLFHMFSISFPRIFQIFHWSPQKVPAPRGTSRSSTKCSSSCTASANWPFHRNSFHMEMCFSICSNLLIYLFVCLSIHLSVYICLSIQLHHLPIYCISRISFFFILHVDSVDYICYLLVCQGAFSGLNKLRVFGWSRATSYAWSTRDPSPSYPCHLQSHTKSWLVSSYYGFIHQNSPLRTIKNHY